jgi:hypothetical protein
MPSASIALLIDAEYVRRCASRRHEIVCGSPIQASRVTIDASRISSFLDSLIVDFDLDASARGGGSRPERRLYDTVSDDRRQRWQQRPAPYLIDVRARPIDDSRSHSSIPTQAPS